MILNKIKLSNFKNFADAEVPLGQMNVLVGANASGKSNFLQAIKFLKHVLFYGIENAVSLQGGIEFLKNIHTSDDDIYMSYEFSHDYLKEYSLKEYWYVMADESVYTIALRVDKDQGYRIVKESLTFRVRMVEIKTEKVLAENTLKLRRDENTSRFESKINKPFAVKRADGTSEKVDSKVLYPEMLSFLEWESFEKTKPKSCFLEKLNRFLPFNNFSIYHLDTELPKKAIPISGKMELEENGENIAIVLKKLLEDSKKRKSLINILSDILPFIQNIEVKGFYDKSLLFTIQESFQRKSIPSSLLSSGTIAMTMMIVVLFFEKKSFAVFEEPDNGIHPGLMAKLMNLFYEASEKKQILITTHNPEVVKHTKPEDLLLISRQPNGSSSIKRPNDSQEVHAFLDNELGMDELFTQNLLDF